MTVVPFAVWKPVPSHSGQMVAHQGLCLHVQVGDGSCYGEFSVPANQASSTWWVSKAGVLEQYVDSDDAAWTEAAGNFTWDSVETEGVPEEPLTDAQIATLARLYAWGVAEYGWPIALAETPQDSGLGWHGMGGVDWGNHPDCPGVLRRAQRQAILTGPPAPSPTPTEVLMPVSPAISFADGKTHVCQASANHLWHKWSVPDSNVWGSEDVFEEAGVPHVDIPDQTPGQSVLANGKLAVTVQDANLRAWFFTQEAGGKWGANELP